MCIVNKYFYCNCFNTYRQVWNLHGPFQVVLGL